MELVPGVDVTIDEISQTLKGAGFINIRSLSLDDIASYRKVQVRERTGKEIPDGEINVIIAEAGKTE